MKLFIHCNNNVLNNNQHLRNLIYIFKAKYSCTVTKYRQLIDLQSIKVFLIRLPNCYDDIHLYEDVKSSTISLYQNM